MIDDAKIRDLILQDMPTLNPWSLQMEDIDFGESVGVWYKTGDNLIIRVQADAHGLKEPDIASALVVKLKERMRPPVPAAERITRAIDYTGRKGRHPRACVCNTCQQKKESIAAHG